MMRLIASAVVLLFAGLAAAPAAATQPGTNGQLAWMRIVGDRPPDLWAANADGSGQRRILSVRRAVEAEPAWSPVAPSTLAFIRETPTQRQEIYLGDLATGRLHRVTRHRAFTFVPSWSPDGRRIVYQTDKDFPPARNRDDPPPPWEIYAIDADGSNPTRLTHDRLYSTDPEYSPDGRQIVFSEARMRRGGLQNRLAIMDADGRNKRPLTNFGGPNEVNPEFMPDGSRIVFENIRDTGNRSDLATIGPEGRDRRLLLATPAYETNPVPSPDGTRIAFTSDRDRRGRQRLGPGFELYTMALDGTDIRRITTNRSPDIFPDWQRLP
jgi:TolB protein